MSVDEALYGSISAVPLRLMSWRLSWARTAAPQTASRQTKKAIFFIRS